MATVLLPLWNTGLWWVRALDFPRMQALLVGIAAVISVVFWIDHIAVKSFLLGILGVCIAVDMYRIGAYLPLMKRESKAPPTVAFQGQCFKTMSVNVQQDNHQYDRLRELILAERPDLVVMVETNGTWLQSLTPLRRTYPQVVAVPLANTYGMTIWSKFEVLRHEVRYLVEDRVPSIFATLAVHGREVDLIVLHPRPPRPQDGPSDERDLELLIVAEQLRNGSNRPTLLLGDLNDVAWSHTTRTFLEVSGLLDPRKGRGFYATFPADMPPLRVPIDHIFHSEHFFLSDLVVLDDVGSDHLPLSASFCLSGQAAVVQDKGPLKPSSKEDAEEIKERAQSGH